MTLREVAFCAVSAAVSAVCVLWGTPEWRWATTETRTPECAEYMADSILSVPCILTTPEPWRDVGKP